MKKLTALVSFGYLILSLTMFTGCESKPTDTPDKPKKAEKHDDHEHHEGDGHEHDDDHKHDERDGHDHKDDHKHGHHPSQGPRGGHLIELGQEDYHAELVHDEKTNKVGIYLLDGQAKAAVAAPMKELLLNLQVDGRATQYKLPAAPSAEDQPGHASKFEAASEELCRLLSDGPEVSGRFNVLIDGKLFVGQIEHDAHDHDHAHEHREAHATDASLKMR